MLRLIVLGEIPGTHVDLSFGQVLLLLAGFYGLLWLGREHILSQKAETRSQA